MTLLTQKVRVDQKQSIYLLINWNNHSRCVSIFYLRQTNVLVFVRHQLNFVSSAENWKSSGLVSSMIMYSFWFDFLMGFHLIIITRFLRRELERELLSLRTKGGQTRRCWHLAWSAPLTPFRLLLCEDKFLLEHDVNMLMCLRLLRHHPTDDESCCVLPT